MLHPFFSEGQKPRIFGHRGYVSAAEAERGIVENSRAAIAAALAAGADYVESDCQLTADGVVVLFHDNTLERTLGDTRRISQVSSAELADAMAERGGLLTLEAALSDFPSARPNLDMKTPEVATPAGTLIGELAPARVLISSFSDTLRREALAAAEVGGIRPATGAGQSAIVKILGAVAMRSASLLDRAFAGIDALQIPVKQGPVKVLSPGLLRAAHARGVEVHIWTVNEPVQMRELVELGVDGIITDRTDVAVAALRGSR
ncbi:glycerophosphodiester phosphodiesterase family protein [Leucobacter aridicollis]|uniref:glycerophosphodiester phosphodiesterase family protein n=1 Tax=Leucobacter aridicollis TaxID=283878 RepID=UPI0021081F2F|nr:glycerophosphodiester phosphodiesterase family protein [Leucobacter aridicollis]UTX54357.1 glycerophosphodiester phosphodiesterase [Leucobacter aridicollis]